MTTFSRRTSSNAQIDVNLYCAQCDAQIGIFENEWIRLTSSYARSKAKGTHFGTEVGQRTQVVPSGPTQRSAEGCVMAEVFCRKCSNMVGQYCKSAPDVEKQPLVDQYFYKLSRTYLKDSSTNAKMEPIFGYGSDIFGLGGSTPSAAPGSGMTPTLRWANTPLRQSSRTPVMSAPGMNRRQSRQSSQMSTLTTEIPDILYSQPYNEMRQLQQELATHKSILDEQSSKAVSQAAVVDGHDSLLRVQDSRLTDQESCLDAQATRIVEQDALIQDQSRRIQAQQLQLTKITGQLTALQKSMADLKNLLPNLGQPSHSQMPENFGLESSSDDFEAMVQKLRKAHRDAQELRALRDENTTMRLQLATYTDTDGGATAVPLQGIEPRDQPLRNSQESQVLGKRKRIGRGRPPASLVVNRITSEEDTGHSLQKGVEQMPTPQSSQSCSGSPLQESAMVMSSRTKPARRKSVGPNSSLPSRDSRSKKQSAGESEARAEHQSHGQNVAEKTSEAAARRSRSKSKRTTVSGSERREDDNISQVVTVVDLEDLNDDTLTADARDAPKRRSTRAAVKVTDNQKSRGDVVTGPLCSSLHAATDESLPAQKDGSMETILSDSTAIDPQLPTVQAASSILGMNLEALIATSEALRTNLPSLQTSTSMPIEHYANHNAVQDIQPSQMGAQAVSQNLDDVEDSHQTEFIQDSAIYDNIDFSDDDDDLMQPNSTLYGDDSLIDGCNTILPVSEESGSSITDTLTRHQHLSDSNFERADRSMAPEPIKQKKPIQVKKRPITLDRIHMATPQIFTEHILAGRAPKAVRPVTTQARERELNEELTQLGLTEWIGKNKYSKEYREAVTTARARFRNSKKAAYLQSRGLNPNLSDPSASLPEQPVETGGLLGQKMPLSETENVPGPSANTCPAQPGLSQDFENEAQISKDGLPATRARVRRSSASLVHGLEDVQDKTAAPKPRAAPGRRKSHGRRKSQQLQSTAVITLEAEMNTEIVQGVNEEGVSPSHAQSTTVETTTGLGEEVVGKLLSIPPQSPAESNSQAATMSKPNHPTVPKQGQAGAPNGNSSKTSRHAPSRLSNNSSPTAEFDNAKTQTQLREEAILLRDRMAKELMEREDMEV